MVKVNTTKLEIIRVATKMFLEKGFSATSVKSICDELEISTGNLTFYFHTKEHILAILVEMLCDFQWAMMQSVVEEGNTSLMALCLEFATMTAMCEESEIAKDFYFSAYSHPITLEIIRKNDAKRAKLVFSDYCPNWEEHNYTETEILVSGIEYASMMITNEDVPIDVRIANALNNIMMTYNVPEEIRKTKIDKVLAMDYRKISRRVFKEFKEYVEKSNNNAFEELLHR
ncbi:MAG: TetR/AcrR family transcriptional regulator [Ruminococcaceae bacterium]|nr:TetR/AcrR family transcriptional regulator [Oscillospiraceae bacterium]